MTKERVSVLLRAHERLDGLGDVRAGETEGRAIQPAHFRHGSTLALVWHHYRVTALLPRPYSERFTGRPLPNSQSAKNDGLRDTQRARWCATIAQFMSSQLPLLSPRAALIQPSPDPPQIPLTAFFRRYPNPFARHVLSVDTLSRYIDPVTGRLHTTRLILKRGILPKWARRVLPLGRGGTGLDTWVLEESVVDPPGGAVIPGRDGGAELHDGLQTPGAGPSTYAESTQPGLRMLQGNMDHRKFMFVKEGGSIRAGKNGYAP